MERMKIEDNDGINEIYLKVTIQDLEEENKKLKMSEKRYKNQYDFDEECLRKLEQENKKLEKENFVMKDRLKFGYKGVTKEEIERVEEENKKLKEEIEKLNLHIEAKDKAYMSLLTDYNYLQARIKRMEKAFLKYVENHKKLEDELDDVIMNR